MLHQIKVQQFYTDLGLSCPGELDRSLADRIQKVWMTRSLASLIMSALAFIRYMLQVPPFRVLAYLDSKCIKSDIWLWIYGFVQTRVPTEIQNHNSMIFHDRQCNFHDYLMHSLQPPL